MVRVALVTSTAFPSLHEDDRLLANALAARGHTPVPAIWSEPSVDWNAFDGIVLRSPWDYFERVPEFRRWLGGRIAGDVPLMNSGDVLTWNLDKRYLRDLEAAGATLVPTEFVEQGERCDLAAIAARRGWSEVVIKPSISGGAYRTHRLTIERAADYADRVEEILTSCGLLIQPFLPEIFEGELSLLFFDGVFSHAVRKRPVGGDYRVQFTFGGTEERVELAPTVIERAAACVRAAPSLPTYARVDGLPMGDDLLLMELEVIEPLLFLRHAPEAPARLAAAIERRLGRGRRDSTGR